MVREDGQKALCHGVQEQLSDSLLGLEGRCAKCLLPSVTVELPAKHQDVCVFQMRTPSAPEGWGVSLVQVRSEASLGS
jgi:hypothetical protein